MKLSTKSRYGTRLMLDMAQHYHDGPIHLAGVAKRQGISVKYLEQIIIPLKRANYILSVRGPKGGHTLARPPEKITVGEIVIWQEAAQAMFDKLHSVTLADVMNLAEPSPSGQGV
jgi:Rrf2 family protein